MSKEKQTLDEWISDYHKAVEEFGPLTIEEYADIISGDDDRCNAGSDAAVVKKKNKWEFEAVDNLLEAVTGRYKALRLLFHVSSCQGIHVANDDSVSAFIEFQKQKNETTDNIVNDVQLYSEIIQGYLAALTEINDKFLSPTEEK